MTFAIAAAVAGTVATFALCAGAQALWHSRVKSLYR